MEIRLGVLIRLRFVIFLLAAAACQAGANSLAQKVVGGVEVNQELRGPLPQQLPRNIYVGDFALDAENYKRDEGVRGALPGRLGQRLPILWHGTMLRIMLDASSRRWPNL